MDTSDRQGVRPGETATAVSDRGAGIAKFRLDRAGCPDAGGSDNQAASARLVGMARFELTTGNPQPSAQIGQGGGEALCSAN
jgi:hypothetical protein